MYDWSSSSASESQSDCGSYIWLNMHLQSRSAFPSTAGQHPVAFIKIVILQNLWIWQRTRINNRMGQNTTNMRLAIYFFCAWVGTLKCQNVTVFFLLLPFPPPFTVTSVQSNAANIIININSVQQVSVHVACLSVRSSPSLVIFLLVTMGFYNPQLLTRHPSNGEKTDLMATHKSYIKSAIQCCVS